MTKEGVTMGKRISTHKIETLSNDIVRKYINAFITDDGTSMLFREVTERDYGVDAILELFENDNPSGKIAFLQIKGTQNTIQPMKKSAAVSCSLTTSNLHYAQQKNIPVILLYVSIEKPEYLYYVEVQTVLDSVSGKFAQKSVTIHIPVENIAGRTGLEKLIEIVRKYY